MGPRFREPSRSHAIVFLWLKAGIGDKPVGVKCACGWVWELPDPWEWRSEGGRADKLLDAYNHHRTEGTPPVTEPVIKFMPDPDDERDDTSGAGWAD